MAITKTGGDDVPSTKGVLAIWCVIIHVPVQDRPTFHAYIYPGPLLSYSVKNYSAFIDHSGQPWTWEGSQGQAMFFLAFIRDELDCGISVMDGCVDSCVLCKPGELYATKCINVSYIYLSKGISCNPWYLSVIFERKATFYYDYAEQTIRVEVRWTDSDISQLIPSPRKLFALSFTGVHDMAALRPRLNAACSLCHGSWLEFDYKPHRGSCNTPRYLYPWQIRTLFP